MSRLFFRLWIIAIAVFVGSIILLNVLHDVLFSEQEWEYFQTLMSCYELAVERVEQASASERAAVLEELESTLDIPVSLVSQNTVSEEVFKQFDHSSIAWEHNDEDDEYIHMQLADRTNLLRFGPLPSYPVRLDLFVALSVIASIVFALCFYLALRPWDRQHRAVEKAAEAIADGRLEARIPNESLPVAPALTESFNRMATQTEAVIKAQQELFRAVSHELRTPISRLRIGVHMLAETDNPDAKIAQSFDLDRDLEQLDDLVEELLTHAKLEGGGDTLNKTTFNLSEAIYEIEDELWDSHTPIRLERDDKADVHLTIQAERRLFHRAVSNLFRNAIRYADSVIRIETRTEDGGVLVIVEDDGPGIPPKDRENVFEPFVRLENSDRQGHGMGLSIVKQVLTWHEGVVRAVDGKRGGCRIETWWPNR